MVRLWNDAKYATRWDGRELQGMDEAAWERFKHLRHDIHNRMRPKPRHDILVTSGNLS